MKVAAASGTPEALRRAAARRAPDFENMVKSLFENASLVNSDLEGIWMGLENGRLEWLEAIKATHTLKMNLKKKLQDDKDSTARRCHRRFKFGYTAFALRIQRLVR